MGGEDPTRKGTSDALNSMDVDSPRRSTSAAEQSFTSNQENAQSTPVLEEEIMKFLELRPWLKGTPISAVVKEFLKQSSEQLRFVSFSRGILVDAPLSFKFHNCC